jgi:hypothetical protein
MIKLKPTDWLPRAVGLHSNQKRPFLWLVSIWVISALVLVFCFHLKHTEMVVYQKPTFRLFLTLFSSLTLLFTTIIGFFLHIEAYASRRNLSLKQVKRYYLGATWICLFAALAILVCLFDYTAQIENDALKTNGVNIKVEIIRKKHKPGKGARDEYYFQLDQTIVDLELLYVQAAPETYQVGDSLWLRILPQNPSIFRTIGPEL